MLENQEKEYQKQIKDHENIWNKKVVDLECEKEEINKKCSALELRLHDICSKREKFDYISGQTDLEKMWQKSKSQTGLPTFPAHENGQGCVSLPTELVSDVRRLEELRHYIQKECDQLLLRKDKLKEEVGQSLSRATHSYSIWETFGHGAQHSMHNLSYKVVETNS